VAIYSGPPPRPKQAPRPSWAQAAAEKNGPQWGNRDMQTCNWTSQSAFREHCQHKERAWLP
jgi:hypothetical protein